MEDDIQNYLSTVMFRGTLCNLSDNGLEGTLVGMDMPNLK